MVMVVVLVQCCTPYFNDEWLGTNKDGRARAWLAEKKRNKKKKEEGEGEKRRGKKKRAECDRRLTS